MTASYPRTADTLPTSEPSQQSPVPRYVLDIPEAAAALRISRAQLFRLIASGELPSIKIGKRRLVPVREVEAFISRQLQNGGAR